ncbi:MAG: acetyl-CoA carboxylase, carboxyltransferase subunit beta [Candidatus Electryonea clarkiae]|nr:acetyl-CoA carboxylase, carboxyltransferase subunit beta [Candidatus Electryonea clarkiae]MDP8289060.1 acetyl-CoA carboxylase, carboxyltransferase subunit beta [Candidatus Electryonea clarkiae]
MANWFKRTSDNLEGSKKRELPEGLWVNCKSCEAVLYAKKLERNYYICPECGHHMRLSSESYITLLTDEGTWKPFEEGMKSQDPLDFRDSKKYTDRIAASMKKTGRNEAVQVGEANLDGHEIVLAVMDFSFLGGSVGSVVGEKISRAIDRAIQKKRSLIIISCSGGMRMQEGVISLMQMAKTSARLTRLAKEKLPFISVLTDPTTGGTTASYSMLGDLNLAEPEALIGFAGPRVIKQTIGQDLPEGFQRSEFLVDHGFIDQVVPRLELKQRIAEFLLLLTAKSPSFKSVSSSSEKEGGSTSED